MKRYTGHCPKLTEMQYANSRAARRENSCCSKISVFLSMILTLRIEVRLIPC